MKTCQSTINWDNQLIHCVLPEQHDGRTHEGSPITNDYFVYWTDAPPTKWWKTSNRLASSAFPRYTHPAKPHASS